MYYPDLSRYEYTSVPDDGEAHLNVGWLDASHPFETGALGDEAVEQLNKLRGRAVNRFRGSHACDYCLAEARLRVPNTGPALMTALEQADALGNGEIAIKGAHGWYHAPVMITHYVERHEYLPPADFVEAVLATKG